LLNLLQSSVCCVNKQIWYTDFITFFKYKKEDLQEKFPQKHHYDVFSKSKWNLVFHLTNVRNMNFITGRPPID